MKRATITISALCYALHQVYFSRINVLSDYCNDTINDRFSTAKRLATEISLELKEAGITKEEAEAHILWYDDTLLKLFTEEE